MSEMVERVALAISGGDDAKNILEIHRHRARAAIEAMREPTDAIAKEGANAMFVHAAPEWVLNLVKRGWCAMIDEALK